MKKLTFILLIAVAAIGLQSFAPGGDAHWSIDPSHSSINFDIRHFFSDVTGSFEKYDGHVHFDPANLEASSFNITVDVNSVNTKNEKRDGHLKSADFFDATNHGSMIFKSTKVYMKEKEIMADGELTIRGVTKKMTVPVNFLGSMDHPMMPGKVVAGLQTSFTIKRTEFGVGSGDWASTAAIGDEVDVTINFEVLK